MGKISNKKQQKRESLLDSAFSLFINNGFSKTSISDIVDSAGVAKGTFYLYFKDKYDIRNHLITHKANQAIQDAYQELQKHPDITAFEEKIVFIMNHILDQLDANHNLVVLLSKHLSWGLLRDNVQLTMGEQTKSVSSIYKEMVDHAEYTYQDPELMIYTIMELVGGASYNAILYQQPVTLAELRPYLVGSVRAIFKQYRLPCSHAQESN